MSASLLKRYWPLAIAILVYAFLANHLVMTQDDAFITYRYVANYLAGDGLVYNIGERIEGFTNFGWTAYLLALGVVGFNFIFWSKLTGFICGALVIGLTFRLAEEVFSRQQKWLVGAATILVGLNQSLAYWSPAGLETAAFAGLALLALYWYMKRNWLLIFALAAAVWIRPEGAVLTAILILIEAISKKGWPRFSLQCASVAFVLSLPFVIFKLAYYGSILPNPFYAKTAFSLGQLSNGLEYAGRFFQHYGFYGLGLIVPLLRFKKLTGAARALLFFVIIYLAYIVLIGGDVLKVHRFFLPLLGPVAILNVLAVGQLADYLPKRRRVLATFPVLLLLAALTYALPLAYVERYDFMEKSLVTKMQAMAVQMKKVDSTNFSVAISTIGSFGYELVGHEIIDLLGLTDSTIARYSEDPIEGMETTWKEQKHNSRYVLQKAPDYIMFSTGIKPSAPAERALFLYRQFTDSYRTVSWLWSNPRPNRPQILRSVFRKLRPLVGEIEPFYPVEYVEQYKLGLEAANTDQLRLAVQHFDRAISLIDGPQTPYMIYQKGFALMRLGEYLPAVRLMDSLLAVDSSFFEAHMSLYSIAAYQGRREKAEAHQRWLQKLVPWLWPMVEQRAAQMIRRERQKQAAGK